MAGGTSGYDSGQQHRIELRVAATCGSGEEMTHGTAYNVISVIAIAVLGFLLFMALFQPGLKYRITARTSESLNSPDFFRTLEALTDSKLEPHTAVEVLPNGDNFYVAELDAIKNAQKNINLEAYIFKHGEIASKLVEALTERARAGVKVHVLLDGVGSGIATTKNDFKPLTEAGGKMFFYHPLRWYNIARYNNRTHREILVVDGKTGFVGGAGIADYWWKNTDEKNPRWRDNMFRITGDAVVSLQGTFIENWLQASEEVLNGIEYFPDDPDDGKVTALVVNSTPSIGGSTRARILFQTLLASAKKNIQITTPYFMPDESVRKELINAVKNRGVKVTVLTAGDHNDHWLSRTSSRRLYGDLLQAGVKIYEYQPSMIHAKVMVIDGLWSVVGSTNFDNRSFGLNDEVNLAGCDEKLASSLDQLFQQDLGRSRVISYQEWKSRPWHEKLREWFGWLLQRQE
jgi:cardiolipin synthase